MLHDTADINTVDFGMKEGPLCNIFCDKQVKVAFHCSSSLLDHKDKTDEDVTTGVTLIHSASGQQELSFQQNLLIHYSNNSLQVRDLSSVTSVEGLK